MKKPVEEWINNISDDVRREKLRKFHSEHWVIFNEAKGSMHKHQNWKGGYRNHIEQCLDIVDTLFERYWFAKFSTDSVIFVLYFHDIEKMFKYGAGKDFTEKEKEALLKEFLTVEEQEAVKYIHGEPDSEYNKTERIMSPLCAVCHSADILSARAFYDRKGI